MSQIANSVSGDGFAGEPDGALEDRIFRLMIAIVSLAVIAGAILPPKLRRSVGACYALHAGV